MIGLRDVAFRGRDVLVSAVLLVLLSPLLVLLSIAVRLDSRGPIFFCQERVGMNGQHFKIHKFRSMKFDRPGLAVSTSVDNRITRLGHTLRSTKLDELPQLYDVLRGAMSLVGPRPEVPQYVAQWPRSLRPVILSVRPGITDPASVLLRREAELLSGQKDPERYYVEELLPQKAEIYAEYVRSRSFRNDIQIIRRTMGALVRTEPKRGP